MRLLIVADEEDPFLWDYYRPGNLDGIDLILSAGDMSAAYLSFLVTMSNRPLLYIHGNHDGNYSEAPPEGCQCIDGKLVTVNGIRILGLGGSLRYSSGPCQYSDGQMRRRIRRLKFQVRRAGGVDIILTHTPPRGWGDLDDPAHRGFASFLPMLDLWKPKYLIHGHIHQRYQPGQKRILHYGETTILNANGKYLLDLEDKPTGIETTK